MTSGDTKIIKLSGEEAARDRSGTEREQPAQLPAVCDPPHLADAISTAGEKIRKARNKPLIILASCLIDDDYLEQVWQRRKTISALGAAGAEPDILINSPGGELNSCFNLARLLGLWLKSWQALVPYFATSGGTLLCLGAASIVMSQRGQLGPLDPHERFFGATRRSPLEALQALRELREFSLESIENIAEFLLEAKVPPERAFAAASETALRFTEPIIAKIEPGDIATFSLNCTMALEYCHRISSPSDPARKAQREVDPTGLVKFSPGHEFVIDFETARRLNFAVSEASPELEDLFDEMRPLLQKVHQYVGIVA